MARNLCSFDRVCMIELYLILRNGFVYVDFIGYIGFYAMFCTNSKLSEMQQRIVDKVIKLKMYSDRYKSMTLNKNRRLLGC